MSDINHDDRTAAARAEDKEENEGTTTTAPDPPEEEKAKAASVAAQPPETDLTESRPTGFTAFRFWCNRRLRETPATLMHGGEARIVEELTLDGQLRLSVGLGGAIIPFDERVIPTLLKQLL